MKAKTFILICLLVPCLMCEAACVNGKTKEQRFPTVDSIVYVTLGRTVTDILLSPSKVNCYLLKGKSEVAKEDVEVEPHYVRDSLLANLSSKEIGILQFVLVFDKDCYKDDSVKVKSPYMPRYEFEFVKKNAVVHVIISLQDYTWTVMYDGKEFAHFNFANKEVVEKFCKMYFNPNE